MGRDREHTDTLNHCMQFMAVLYRLMVVYDKGEFILSTSGRSPRHNGLRVNKGQGSRYKNQSCKQFWLTCTHSICYRTIHFAIRDCPMSRDQLTVPSRHLGSAQCAGSEPSLRSELGRRESW